MYNHSSVKKTCKWKINWWKICKDQNFRNSVLVLFLWAESRNFKSVFQGKTGKEVKVSLEISWRMKKTLGCQLSPSPDIFLVGWPLRCLEGVGAVFTSHFPLCSFRQWEPSGLKQKSSSPLLVILLFRGFYESSISWLRWAKLIWLSVTTWQHQFIVFIPLPPRSWLNFWRSSRTNSICEVAGCEGSTILSSSSFYFYNPTFTSAGPEASIPISLKALGAASNL